MELPLKYAYTVYKEKSFSKAAAKLFVSQPALSATVSKLENSLGFKIFDRSSSPISLTLRGKIYIDYIEDIYEKENILNQRLSSLNEMTCGSLSIGGGSYSANYLLSTICGKFHRKYPDTNIMLDMNPSNKKINENTLDIRFAFAPNFATQEVIPILEERLILAINKNYPYAKKLSKYALTYQEICTNNIPDNKTIYDVSVLDNLPFIKSGNFSDSDNRLSQIFPKHKTSPCIVLNTHTFDIRYHLMEQGLGTIFVSDTFVKTFSINQNNICFFVLKDPLSYRTLYITRAKNHTKNQTADNFIDFALEYCKSEKLISSTPQ